uniref:BEN domain-containing protein n=1 Tax=Anopheles epiroticus TaxID=199890 RepID=A0A182PFP3_9DIPT
MPMPRTYGDDQWSLIKDAKRQRCDSGPSIALKDGSGQRRRMSSTTGTVPEPAVNMDEIININSDNQLPSRPGSPTVHIARTRIVQASRQEAPPMTFDQQTQTTGTASEAFTASYEAHFTRIVSYLESIMAEQKSCRMESDYHRKLVHELHEKMLEQHAMLTNVQEQVTEMQKERTTVNNKLTSTTTTASTTTTTRNEESNLIIPNVLPSFEETKISSCATESNTVYSFEATTDTTIGSTNNNHIVVNVNESGNEQWVQLQKKNQPIVVQIEQEASNRGQSWTSSFVQSDDNTMDDATLETTNSESTMIVEFENETPRATPVHEQIRDDWSDSLPESSPATEGTTVTNASMKKNYSEEMVRLGKHNTQISRYDLEKIKWTNYRCGTRKLLVKLFPREVLANCSLSGRPCPAMSHDPGRVTKKPLMPNVVADIIEYVMKRCKVDESQVRNVITTKCADENKMLRQRQKLAEQ